MTKRKDDEWGFPVPTNDVEPHKYVRDPQYPVNKIRTIIPEEQGPTISGSMLGHVDYSISLFSKDTEPAWLKERRLEQQRKRFKDEMARMQQEAEEGPSKNSGTDPRNIIYEPRPIYASSILDGEDFGIPPKRDAGAALPPKHSPFGAGIRDPYSLDDLHLQIEEAGRGVIRGFAAAPTNAPIEALESQLAARGLTLNDRADIASAQRVQEGIETQSMRRGSITRPTNTTSEGPLKPLSPKPKPRP